MVAYSFKTRFEDEIKSGRKRQTIRAERKRHVRPGEPIQLYVGMRTKSCRKIVDPDPVCTEVFPIHIAIPHSLEHPVLVAHPAIVLGPDCPWQTDVLSDEFARRDGFVDAADFHAFWLREHGACLFRGVVIRWDLRT